MIKGGVPEKSVQRCITNRYESTPAFALERNQKNRQEVVQKLTV